MNYLPTIVRLSGPWGFALVVLACVVLFLTAKAVFGGRREGSVPMGAQANAVLFWGGIAAVMGFLGQCQGVFIALNNILAAPEISPQVVAEGFVISFVPTLFGLGILVFSGIAWLTLRFFSPGIVGTATVFLSLTIVFGCTARGQEVPESLTAGVWALETPGNVFLWDFESGRSGDLTCIVHDVLGGLKFTETLCESASLDGGVLEIVMPNGVRYRGSLEFGKGLIDGELLYTDGSSREAPLDWAPLSQFPTLESRPEEKGPYSYSVPNELDDGWRVAHAEEHGVDPAALERMITAILEGEAGFLKSILVARGGYLLLEEYFHGYGPDRPSPIASCTKTISSLLVGLAIQEGKIESVDVPLLEFFPDQRDGVGSGWEDLTLEHLLTMSLALDWNAEEVESLHGTGPEAFGRILARNVVGRPGQDFQYVSMNVNLLAGVLHHATGEHAERFGARALFEPLGISEWNWEPLKTEGFNLMDGSLRLRPRDMGKIGAMVMNRGTWAGVSVVNENWIENSLTPYLAADSQGGKYGFLWWMMPIPGPDGHPMDVWFANGWGSQFILLFPDLDLVVVTTGGNQENGKHLAVGEVLMRELLPGVGAAPGR